MLLAILIVGAMWALTLLAIAFGNWYRDKLIYQRLQNGESPQGKSPMVMRMERENSYSDFRRKIAVEHFGLKEGPKFRDLYGKKNVSA